MVSDIKLESIDSLNRMASTKNITGAQSSQRGEANLEEGISIQLSSFSNMTIADNSHAENQRVVDMKRKIEEGSYAIDINALAKKLLPNLSKSIG